MEETSIISYFKNKQYIVDLLLLPCISIYIVIFLSNYNVKYIVYNNEYIIIDYWFFIHIVNTILIVLFYPYKLTVYKFWTLVLGWEIIENIIMPEIIIPNINYNICNFKENTKDTMGDLVAAIPASFILLYKNRIK